MNKFVLIDGNAILHRAFHALPPLTNKKGELTNAVYGFFSMLLKIIQDVNPQYVAVCFDRPKPTFRQTLYAGYQAHRPKMDEGLVPQVEMVHRVLEEAKIPIFEVDGYEADDVIGTLSNQAVSGLSAATPSLARRRKRPSVPPFGGTRDTPRLSAGSNARLAHEQTADRPSDSEVIIVSGDRDLLQLVNSSTMVLAPITGITKMILYDEKAVEEKYGIKPKQIVDYKALVGDPSDNYPGVSGVGPKTASDLLKEYGSLENIYQSLEEIKKKNPNLAMKLAEGAEAAGLAKKLAAIVKDAPVSLDIKKCEVGKFDEEGLRREFEKLGFKSLIKRISNEIPNPKSQMTNKSQAQNSNDKPNNNDGQLELICE